MSEILFVQSDVCEAEIGLGFGDPLPFGKINLFVKRLNLLILGTLKKKRRVLYLVTSQITESFPS
jgi:hypothetical protein